MPDHDRWTTFNPHDRAVWHVRWTGASTAKPAPALVAPAPAPKPAPAVKAPAPVVASVQPAPAATETAVVHERFSAETQAQSLQAAGQEVTPAGGGMSWTGIILGVVALLIVLVLILALTRRGDGPAKS